MSERWFEHLDPGEEDAAAIERQRRRREREQSRRAGRGSGGGRSRPARGGAGGGGGGPGGRSKGHMPRLPGGMPVAVLGAAGLLAIFVAWFLIALFQPFHGDGSGRPFTLRVPSGAGVGEVGDLLDSRGVISSSTMFEIRATLAGKRSELYHGDHTFRKDMSYSAALDELSTKPRRKVVDVVIPEGYSRSQIADTAAADGLPGNYMRATVHSKHLKPNAYGAQGRAKNLEGFLFPATYELKPGSTVADLVDQQLAAFKQNIAGVDMSYARKKNLTTYDVLIIASMIEREVAVPRERKLVAAVIYNRLKQGIPLGIDATTRFAVGNYDEPLTESELDVDSPYNTRTHQGLPPGPIGNPGLASIEAAAHPARVGYTYYVVKPNTCGEHSFSSSYRQFMKDSKRYERAREKQGGAPTDC